MANGNRTLTLVIVLIVGLGMGWFIGHSQPSPQPQPTPVPTAVVPPPTPIPTPACTLGAAPVPSAKDWKLIVGPDNPCTVKDDHGQLVPIAVISKKQGHKIEFRSSDPNKSLLVIIHVPQASSRPFNNLAFDGYDQQGLVKWLLYCHDFQKSCSTGPALGNAAYDCYKYDQILDGKLCDARIIIQP